MLDVRVPIGWLFTVYGVLLVGSGLFHPELTTIEGQNITFNLNLIWGTLMGLFGVMMTSLAAMEAKKKPNTDDAKK